MLAQVVLGAVVLLLPPRALASPRKIPFTIQSTGIYGAPINEPSSVMVNKRVPFQSLLVSMNLEITSYRLVYQQEMCPFSKKNWSCILIFC